MSDWKHYLVTRVETEEQIVSRIENAAELVPEPAFDYAVREIELKAARKEIERLQSELTKQQGLTQAAFDMRDKDVEEMRKKYSKSELRFNEVFDSLSSYVEFYDQLLELCGFKKDSLPSGPMDNAIVEHIVNLEAQLKSANDDANRLAEALGYFFSEDGEVYYDISPALIAHKLRLENKK